MTEKPERIQDIYEELIGVDAISGDTPGVMECLNKANALPNDIPMSRVDGGTNYSIPFDINLSYDWLDDGDLPQWGPNGALITGKSFSLKGGVKGTLGLRLAYEFSKERSFLSIGTDYEYTPYFNLSFAANATWILPFYEPMTFPVINIPIPSAPIFTLQFGAAPFISLSGSACVQLDKTFPTTKMRNLAYYLDGEYRSGSANVSEKGADNKGDLTLSISLEGSAKVGLMMAMYIGTQSVCRSSVGIMAELSVGPKLSGSIGVLPYSVSQSEPDTISYKLMKDWGISATWCSLDLSLNYYREVLGKPKSYQFASMTYDLDPFTYSFLPTFETPTLSIASKDEITDWSSQWLVPTYANITMPRPQGNSIFPVRPGVALYDEDGKCDFVFIFEKEDGSYLNYWMGTKSDPAFDNMKIDYFSSWELNKKYKMYPVFQFSQTTNGGYNGGVIRVDTYSEVTIEGEMITGDYYINNDTDIDSDSLTDPLVKLQGCLGENIRKNTEFHGQYGFIVGKNNDEMEYDNPNLIIRPGKAIEPYDISFDSGELLCLSSSTTYYYRAYAQIGNKYIYGDIRSFTTPKSKKIDE